jgi:hypothetical protein
LKLLWLSGEQPCRSIKALKQFDGRGSNAEKTK